MFESALRYTHFYKHVDGKRALLNALWPPSELSRFTCSRNGPVTFRVRNFGLEKEAG